MRFLTAGDDSKRVTLGPTLQNRSLGTSISSDRSGLKSFAERNLSDGFENRSREISNSCDRSGQKSFAARNLSDVLEDRGKIPKNGPAEVENQVFTIKKKFQPKKLPVTAENGK